MKKLLLVILALTLICASAQAFQVLQPKDKVYFRETVDIGLVVGWTGKLAWWADGEYGQIPDLIVDASSYQHKFYIDPEKFRYGNWYKWDGVYEPSGYNIAFVIERGIRPEPTPPPTNYTEILITPIQTPVQYAPQGTHLIIAKGDGYTFEYFFSGTGFGDGHLWIFGRQQGLFNEPITLSENTSVYSYQLTPHITEGLDVGWYTGYIQFNGKNERQDIFYDEKNNVMDTPYKSIDPVSLKGFLPQRVQTEFEKLAQNKAYFDDNLVKLTMEIKDPYIQLNDYYEESDQVVVEGTSSMAAGTVISFTIDPKRWTTTGERKAHTTTTKLEGDIREIRKFIVKIPVMWEEMAIGEHTVTGTIDVNNIRISQNKDFNVISVNVNPTPIPEQIKMINEEYGYHVVNNSNVTYSRLPNGTIQLVPTPTPQIIYVTQPAPTPIIKIVTVYVTAPPTTPTPTPTQESPLPAVLGIGALMVCAYVVLRKR